MNNDEKYFVSLIYSFLNKTTPETPVDVEWAQVYKLANINNLCGVIATQMLKLDKKYQPDSQLASTFRQQLGYTVIDFDEKEKAVAQIKKILNDNQIKFILVKGQVIKNYYPVKELRTSSDIDVIIPFVDYKRILSIFKSSNIEIEDSSTYYSTIKINNQHIEIHTQLDFDNKYFENIFDIATNVGYEYFLDDYNHLLYVLCHIIKHFRSCGAGIKMFMDIDVLVRHIDNFDYNKILDICKSLNIETFCKSAFSMCNYLFGTPVKAEINMNENVQLRQLFEDEIINGGSFGLSRRDIGNHYKINASKNGKVSKFNAILTFLFPSPKYLKGYYEYCRKHPVLIPIAWFNRLFEGIFKRGSHSLATLASINASDENDNNYIQLLNELDI